MSAAVPYDVRPVAAGEQAQVVDVLVAAFLSHHVRYIPEDVDAEWVEDYSRDLIAASWREMLLAWADGEAVAMLWRRGGKIEALNARPDWLRRGAGGALMDVAEADMRREGIATAEVDTYAANRIARAFCAKRGYLVTRTWEQTAFTKQPIPMVTMSRNLADPAPTGEDVTGA